MFLKGNVPTTGKFKYEHFIECLTKDLGCDESYTKKALVTARYLSHTHIEQLAKLTDNADYRTRQVLATFQKNESLINAKRDTILREEAFSRFQHCEMRNSRYNLASFHTSRIDHVLRSARKIISQILALPPEPKNLYYHFGPGATQLNRQPSVHEYFKFTNSEFSGSKHAYEMFGDIIVRDKRFATKQLLEQTDFDLLTSVPKSYKARRTISLAPELNILAQLGIGSALANRICKLPYLNIREGGQDRNRSLAREGSINGTYATIDLSSASDSLPLGLIRDLFVDYRFDNLFGWYRLFLASRLESFRYQDSTYSYSMIAPMGNGFTFPLETLVFFSILKAYQQSLSLEGEIYVYGDDIIVPTDFAMHAIEILHRFGFVINQDKSFTGGPFRESCGADYLSGVDIRPVYLRQTPDNVFDIFSLINRLRGRSHLWRSTLTDDYLLSLVPPKYRAYGPPCENVREYIHIRGLDTQTLRVRKHIKDGLLHYEDLGQSSIVDEAVLWKDIWLDERTLFYMSLASMDRHYSDEYLALPFYKREPRIPVRIYDPRIRFVRRK
jgi:hypothetical protein